MGAVSIRALNWAWSVQGVTSTQKFLLVALADFADEEDACFPAQDRLASMIGTARETVSRNLGALEEVGLISRSRRSRVDGSRTSDRFVLAVGQCAESSRDPASGPMCASRGDNVTQTGGREPSLNHQGTTNPSIVSPSREVAVAAGSAFDVFWDVYPRKVGKPVAARAFDKAIARAGSAAVVVDGARRLAADPNLPEKQFVPHPSTWLNRDGWADEALPARGGRGSVVSRGHEADAILSAHDADPRIGELSA